MWVFKPRKPFIYFLMLLSLGHLSKRELAEVGSHQSDDANATKPALKARPANEAEEMEASKIRKALGKKRREEYKLKLKKAAEEEERQKMLACQKPVIDIYDKNPQHPFNHLYDLLFVRADGKGCYWGKDIVDPLLFGDSEYLFEKKRFQDVLASLESLIGQSVGSLKQDPLRRALFQRDLLLVHHWLVANKHYSTANGQRLEVLLRKAILHVALSEKELEALPDNLPVAIATHPDELPANLMSSVMVSAQDGPVAPVHFREFHGASAFFAYYMLPGGYIETANYVRALGSQKSPMLKDYSSKNYYYRNPQTPQFPSGSSFALVRKAILLSDKGIPFVSPLTESIQFRKYVRVGESNSYGLDQEVAKLDLSRKKLLAGVEGGMEKVTYDSVSYEIFLRNDTDWVGSKGATPEAPLSKCVKCHMQMPPSGQQPNIGIHTVHTYSRDVGGGHWTAKLVNGGVNMEIQKTLEATRKNQSWQLLSDGKKE